MIQRSLISESIRPGKPFNKTIAEVQEERKRWLKHFSELLNRPAQLNSPDIEAMHTNFPIDDGPPPTGEITQVIVCFKSVGAAGPTEALKSNTDVKIMTFHVLLRRIWEEEQTPTDWK